MSFNTQTQAGEPAEPSNEARSWIDFFDALPPHDKVSALAAINARTYFSASTPNTQPTASMSTLAESSTHNTLAPQTIDLRPKKPKYPQPLDFKGEQKIHVVESFLFSLKRYLQYYEITGRDAVDLSIAYLKGNALTWWRLRDISDTEHPDYIGSLPEFERAIRDKFIPKIAKRQLVNRLDELTQTGSILKYNESFRHLLLQLPDLDNKEDNIYRYLRGMKKRTRIEVELRLEPTHTLEEVMQMAELYDSIMFGIPIEKKVGTFKRNPSNGVVPMDLDNINLQKRPIENRNPSTDTSKGFLRKLNDNEREKLRRIGGCFRCRKPGHVASDPICELNQGKSVNNVNFRLPRANTATTSTQSTPSPGKLDKRKKNMMSNDSDTDD